MSVWRPASRAMSHKPSAVTITDSEGNVRIIEPDPSGFTCWKHHVRDCHRCEIGASAIVKSERDFAYGERRGKDRPKKKRQR